MLRFPRDGPRLLRRIIQTINSTMKKYLSALAALALLFACTPVDNNSESDSDGDNKEPSGAVDLGLSVKWATCNIGANAPEEYGDYYAWGETESKEKYNWSTYKWWNGSSNTLTKYKKSSSYGTVDNKTVLDLEDDVAHVKLGGSWRMPTDAEWTELRTQCTWTWTTQNGVTGRLVTASNGNSIFLPAAGYWYVTGLYNAGFSGYYWSSSLYTDFPRNAWYVDFISDYVYRYLFTRYSGQSVRPVSE